MRPKKRVMDEIHGENCEPRTFPSTDNDAGNFLSSSETESPLKIVDDSVKNIFPSVNHELGDIFRESDEILSPEVSLYPNFILERGYFGSGHCYATHLVSGYIFFEIDFANTWELGSIIDNGRPHEQNDMARLEDDRKQARFEAAQDFFSRVMCDILVKSKTQIDHEADTFWESGQFVMKSGLCSISRIRMFGTDAPANIRLRTRVPYYPEYETRPGFDLALELLDALEARGMEDLRKWCDSVEDQCVLRDRVHHEGGIAFVANGSILARRPGGPSSSGPLKDALPFVAPASLSKTFSVPNAGEVEGMLIPPGVTIIAGGGFHGKSTLLKAIAAGAFYKTPNDGREFVVSEQALQSIRAEDGRCVDGTDISPFITDLPTGAHLDPRDFRTQNASGSTSQASNVIEAIGAGARLLLVDEDTSAGNFLVRDSRMRSLVRAEPIVPFIYRVNGLHLDLGISTIIVVGGCGDWLDVHDTALLMENYRCLDATKRAHSISKTFCTGRVQYNGRGLVHKLDWPGFQRLDGPVAVLARLAGSWGNDPGQNGLLRAGPSGRHGRICLGTYGLSTTIRAEADLSRVEELMPDDVAGMDLGIAVILVYLVAEIRRARDHAGGPVAVGLETLMRCILDPASGDVAEMNEELIGPCSWKKPKQCSLFHILGRLLALGYKFSLDVLPGESVAMALARLPTPRAMEVRSAIRRLRLL